MPRLKRLQTSALNVKLFKEPSPAKYVELFNYLHANMKWDQIWSDRYGFIKEFDQYEAENGTVYCEGEITRFVGKKWIEKFLGEGRIKSEIRFDNQTIYIDGQVAGIEKSVIDIILDPEKHLLFFSTDNVKPESFRRFVAKLVQTPMVPMRFGHVDVELVSSPTAVDKIVSLSQLKSIKIMLTVPNGDINDDDDRYLQHLRERNIHKMEVRYSAPDDSSRKKYISFDNDSNGIRFMRQALIDGEIVAYYEGPKGGLSRFGSRSEPLLLTSKYNSREVTSKKALLASVSEFADSIDKIKRGQVSLEWKGE